MGEESYMLLVSLGVENALVTSDSICLLIGGKESYLLCKASKGSSEIEGGRCSSYSPPHFPFWSRRILACIVFLQEEHI